MLSVTFEHAGVGVPLVSVNVSHNDVCRFTLNARARHGVSAQGWVTNLPGSGGASGGVGVFSREDWASLLDRIGVNPLQSELLAVRLDESLGQALDFLTSSDLPAKLISRLSFTFVDPA